VPVPPILEIYVVWHPDDDLGAQAAGWLMEHFHGPAFAGLAGGAVEVYTRSAAWQASEGPPRPMPFMTELPGGLPQAEITAVVPVLGRGLARAVRTDPAWREYVSGLFAADPHGGATAAGPPTVGVYPLRVPRHDLSGTALAELTRAPQAMPMAAAENPATLGRELAQAITQRLHRRGGESDDERVTVFISHTKWHTAARYDEGTRLVETVRSVLHDTRLDAFFDAHDIQVGSDWVGRLDAEAGRNALLMVRTDLYASREWTQREVLTAKRHDLPVVALYAVRDQEDRGSFLMDHVPVVPCSAEAPERAVEKALNRLVDEALKAALWRAQSAYLRSDGFDWLPAHAPEPVTLLPWLRRHPDARGGRRLLILHPDPPLGPREYEVLVDLCRLCGVDGDVDVLTPRTYAARGGRVAR
jgi:hypothetical protein